MKKNSRVLNNQQGFALITAMMMLFAATILGLMVMNSSEIEIILSGAQQRYESDFNTTEGAASIEAAAVGTGDTITVSGQDRSYAVVDPGDYPNTLSPEAGDEALAIYDPGDDAETTTFDGDDPNTWPLSNLLTSVDSDDNTFDYHYRVSYEYPTNPPKGYDATKFSGYMFQISAQRSTLIEMGGSKVGPKASL